ncbi:type II toxin-antitoxin system RelE/ParE family toxin [Capnocytophaga canimorsus]|uniref:type II toxin-antitoxin system RelE/ParE family toxin n=1 Tax=Capnocytophaga canimorsus TaxID=28188 RepID=UPI001ACB883D|nr:type II toxin-antitoxin system RelE/ParE family toxin [Capnocytophaga canimorsus]GIM59847.1 hypothetical protein CAPN007_20560 [Capnocytophaga canimorsus]
MNYRFELSPEFRKEFKALFKKYKSLKKDFENLAEEIQNNPNIGTKLGDGFRKIRLNITSKNKGKSGGARVITHEVIISLEKEDDTKSVLFVSIYDKSEYDIVDLNVIKEITERFREESNE